MASSFQKMRTRGSATTSAITVASRFSSLAYPRNSFTSAAAMAQAMRSWLSEIAGLSAVKAVVFLRNLIEVDTQAVSDLAQGNRHAARAEVVTALDETAGLAATEQPLKLALDRGVALLHLGTAMLKALEVVRLRGTGRAADAIAAGAPAQKDDDVARLGLLATHA